jgi:purine-binding chemotaxis protein CheW
VNEVRQFISFYLESRLYGLDIRIVKEINPNTRLTAVPRTAPHIRGLVNIRGQVVLVMDIAVIFGRKSRPVTEQSQVVILKTAAEIRAARGLTSSLDPTPFGDKAVGFLVDRIGDVTGVTADAIEPVPAHVEEANARYFAGVVRQQEGLQMILDAGALLIEPAWALTEEQRWF